MISRLALIAALLSSGCRTREASDHERPRARREHREARHAPAPTSSEAPAPRPEGAVLAAALLGHQAASQLAVVACRELEPSAGLDACPLDPDQVASVEDVDEGVRLRLSPQAGIALDALQQKIGCHQARVEARAASARLAALPGTTQPPAPAEAPPPAAPEPVSCALDMTDLRVDVARPADAIEIRILTNAEQLPELRRRVQSLVVDRRSALR